MTRFKEMLNAIADKFPPPPSPPADRHLCEGDTKPQEFRIIRYHHGFFDKWVYRLERRHIIRFLFWTWEQWEWVAGNDHSEQGSARRWMDIYPVKEITEVPLGYNANYRWSRAKRLPCCRYRIDIYTHSTYHSEAFLMKRFLFLWIIVKHAKTATHGLIEGETRCWQERYGIPDEQVEFKPYDPWTN